jgi:hypothetical protein
MLSTLTNGEEKCLEINHICELHSAIKVDEFDQINSTKFRMLKAVLDIIIVKELSRQKIVSVPNIIAFLMKEYGISVSAGMVYPAFKRLETQERSLKLPNKKTRIYIITVDGLDSLSIIQRQAYELQTFLLELIIAKRGSRN